MFASTSPPERSIQTIRAEVLPEHITLFLPIAFIEFMIPMEDPHAKRLPRWMRLIKANATPASIALGVAAGWIFGQIPKDNLLAVGLLLAPLFAHAHWLSFAAAATFGFCTIGLVDPTADSLGNSILHLAVARPVLAWLHNLPFLAWCGLNNTVVVGSSVIGLIACPVLYYGTALTVQCLQRAHVEYEANRLVVQVGSYWQQIRKLRTLRATPPVIATEATSFLDTESPIFEPLPDAESMAEDSAGKNPTQRWIMADANKSLRLDGDHGVTSSQPPVTAAPIHAPPTEPKEKSVKPLSAWKADSIQAALQELRIDSEHALNSLAPVTSTTEKKREKHFASQLDPSSIKLGDILQETTIDIVRMKPILNSTLGGTSFSNTHLSNSHLNNPQLGTAVTSPSPQLASTIVASVSSASTSVASMNPVEPTKMGNEPPSMALPDLPAEESLRFLLWHLHGSKRENKA